MELIYRNVSLGLIFQYKLEILILNGERFVVSIIGLSYTVFTPHEEAGIHTPHALKQACVYDMNLVHDGINEHSVVQRFRQVSESHSASDFSIVSTRRLLIIHGVDFWCDSAAHRIQPV